MTTYKTNIESQVGTAIVTQTQVAPGGGVALSADEIYSGSIEIFAVVIDNSLNTEISYLKMWTAAPNIGTTVPTVILKVDAAVKVQYSFDTGIEMSAIHAAVVTTAGTAGATAPSGTMTINYLLG